MEQLPIVIDGQACGTVRFRREGAYIICRGQANYGGDMVRLWIYGRGEPGYLGVLIPDGQGGAAVRKKFSLSDFANLPSPMEYCAPERLAASAAAAPACETDVIWYEVGDGTLVHYDGKRKYMAFPAQEMRLPRGTRFVLRTIEGKEYAIFPC